MQLASLKSRFFTRKIPKFLVTIAGNLPIPTRVPRTVLVWIHPVELTVPGEARFVLAIRLAITAQAIS